MTAKLQLKLVKSYIGRKPKHVGIVKQLGLTKLNKTVIHPDNPAMRGLINQVAYMVEFEVLTS